MYILPDHVDQDVYILPDHVDQDVYILPDHVDQDVYTLPDHVDQDVNILPDHEDQDVYILPDHVDQDVYSTWSCRSRCILPDHEDKDVYIIPDHEVVVVENKYLTCVLEQDQFPILDTKTNMHKKIKYFFIPLAGEPFLLVSYIFTLNFGHRVNI